MKKLGIIAISLITMNANAIELSPYYGVGLSADNAKFDKNVIGIANIANWNAAPDINAGVDVGDFLGFEFGYYQNNKRHKNTLMTPPSVYLGRVTAAGLAFDTGDVRRLTYRNSAIRFSLTARYPILEEYNVSAIGMLGVAWEKNRIIDETIVDNGQPVARITAVYSLHSQTRALATITAGAKWQFSENTGLRVLATWQNRTRLPEMHGDDDGGLSPVRAPMKNSFRYTVGIYTYL